jgi:dTDP-4-amino-4,6-dideoxygalactose transaminase
MVDPIQGELGQPVVPMSAPDLTDEERQAVAKVLSTPQLSLGPQLQAFEEAVADALGARHAVAVNSGTAGLHLCVRAAGIADGDLVITTPFSFAASANVLLYERAIPVFVDVDPVAGNLDPDLAGEAAADLIRGGRAASRWLPRRGAEHATTLKAILPVDVFGQPADYDRLRRTANGRKLALIEDSCEALGSTYEGQPAGLLGDAGVFGFYPNKQITTGEGGMVVTQRDDWATLIRALRNQGRAPGDTWLEHTYLGYNYRLDEMSAALGRVQISRLEQLLQRRQQVAERYQAGLAGLKQVETPEVLPSTTRLGWFVYVVRFESGALRREVSQQLGKRGIPSRPYFAPIHLQRYFVERFGYQAGDFPVVEDLGERSLALPFSGVMTESEVGMVCNAIREILAGR